MSDAPATTPEDASTVRRRKILANSQKRLERLQRLKRAEVDNTVMTNCENLPEVSKNEEKTTSENHEDTPQDVAVASQSTNISVEAKKTERFGQEETEVSYPPTSASAPDRRSNQGCPSSSEEEEGEDRYNNDDGDIVGDDDDGSGHATAAEIPQKLVTEPSNSSALPSSSLGSSGGKIPMTANFLSQSGSANTENAEEEETLPLSWFFRKRRLIIFILLALVSYCIAHKGLDVYLTAFLGSVWRKGGGVGKDSFARLYGAVELQMVVVALMGGGSDAGSSSHVPAVLRLAINLAGLPEPLLKVAGKLSSCVQMVVTDFSVYLFTYVLLGQVGF